MTLLELQDTIQTWADAGDRVALATLIAVRRSAPLPPGARFAINDAGALDGSISSGCVESDLHERLSRLLAGEAPGVVTYGITDEMAAGVGLSCGGKIAVFIERLEESA